MSEEMYSRDSKGKKQDASIHDEILDNPKADYATRQQSAQRAQARGMPLETIRALYGVLPDDIPKDALGWCRGVDGEVLRTANGKPIPASAYDGEPESPIPITVEDMVNTMRRLGMEPSQSLLAKLPKGFEG